MRSLDTCLKLLRLWEEMQDSSWFSIAHRRGVLVSAKRRDSHTIHAAAGYCPKGCGQCSSGGWCCCFSMLVHWASSRTFPSEEQSHCLCSQPSQRRELKAISKAGMLKSELLEPTPTFVDFHHCFPWHHPQVVSSFASRRLSTEAFSQRGGNRKSLEKVPPILLPVPLYILWI